MGGGQRRLCSLRHRIFNSVALADTGCWIATSGRSPGRGKRGGQGEVGCAIDRRATGRFVYPAPTDWLILRRTDVARAPMRQLIPDAAAVVWTSCPRVVICRLAPPPTLAERGSRPQPLISILTSDARPLRPSLSCLSLSCPVLSYQLRRNQVDLSLVTEMRCQ